MRKKINLLENDIEKMIISDEDSNKKSLVIGNSHKSIDNSNSNSHEWTIYVTDINGKDCSTYIESVTFFLHPTFSPNSVTITKSPFSLTRIGWGTFTIKIGIKFKNGSEGKFSHSLSFEKGGNETTHNIEL